MNHPLHPALVHFPIAAWSLATLGDWAGVLVSLPWLQQTTAVLLAAGLALGLLAATAGFWELLKLPAGHPAERTAYLHMSLALGSWCLYAGSLFLRIDHRQLVAPSSTALWLSGLGLLALLATGGLGGHLVYHHGVGVRRDL